MIDLKRTKWIWLVCLGAGVALIFVLRNQDSPVSPQSAKPVVTTIETGKAFYPAEAYHQDFLNRNPDYPYIVVNDMPKVTALKRLFPALYKG